MTHKTPSRSAARINMDQAARMSNPITISWASGQCARRKRHVLLRARAVNRRRTR